MAPETLLAGPKGAKGMLPLPQLAEEVICSCPIDARRALYRNIVLCVSPLPPAGRGSPERCS